eukprot:1160757-Pelagomonas_calceolata.AAC.3
MTFNPCGEGEEEEPKERNGNVNSAIYLLWHRAQRRCGVLSKVRLVVEVLDPPLTAMSIAIDYLCFYFQGFYVLRLQHACSNSTAVGTCLSRWYGSPCKWWIPPLVCQSCHEGMRESNRPVSLKRDLFEPETPQTASSGAPIQRGSCQGKLFLASRDPLQNFQYSSALRLFKGTNMY